MPNLILKQIKSTFLETSLRSMIAKKEESKKYSLLLCDVSGSMQETAHGERKIDTLTRTVNRLVHVGEKKCKLIEFSSQSRNVAKLSDCGGSTNLVAALRLAQSHRNANQIIVVSDGYPNEPDERTAPQLCFEAAHQIACPINCIYIGPGEDEGYKFLLALARANKGTATATENEPKALEHQVRLMLTMQAELDG